MERLFATTEKLQNEMHAATSKFMERLSDDNLLTLLKLFHSDSGAFTRELQSRLGLGDFATLLATPFIGELARRTQSLALELQNGKGIDDE